MVNQAFKNIVLLMIIVNALKAQSESENIIVNTSLGQVRGSLMKTLQEKTIYAFRGLKYAEAPVEKLRFKDPINVKPWKGIFDASKEGPACVQFTGDLMSEDCLTLNIYTKDIGKKDAESANKRPVIVFIHAGGYMAGTSQSFQYHPLYLLDQDVVLVTINHRLNTLGFINTGDEYATGNYGFKDQVLALQFIRNHITAFGGDPNSITLTGQSAGARSIILHLVSPMSKGLFHRAIAMSGTGITPIPPQKEQIDLAFKHAKLLDCPIETRDKMFTCLRNTSAEEFHKTADSFKIWYEEPVLVWYPSIEPDIPGTSNFLNDNPENLIENGQINSVPLIIGYTKDEFSMRPIKGIEESLNGNNKYFDELNKYWLELAPICFGYEEETKRSKYISQQLRQYYFGDENISLNNSDSLQKLFAHAIAQYPIYRTARLIAKYSSSPVYFYEFTYQGRYTGHTWSGTNEPAAGVAHGDDLPYILHMPMNKKFPVITRNNSEFFMVERLTNIWAHFARTSEPLPKNGQLFGDVDWPRFTSENQDYLDIGRDMRVGKDIFSETKDLWDGLFPEHF